MITTSISVIDKEWSPKMRSLPPLQLKHRLVLYMGEDGQAQFFEEALPGFLDHLRSIVDHDRNLPENTGTPRIDAVCFEGLIHRAPPGERTWRALDGLRPRHLDFYCGWDEEYDIESLDQLATTWPLESIAIHGACGVNLTSKYLHFITSLKLDYCCGMTITSYPEPSALRHLTIIENDAVDMFVDMRRNVAIADGIQTLEIQSTMDNDFCKESAGDFVKTLEQCTTLLTLHLTLKESDTEEVNYLRHLPDYFPPNIEDLRFRGPPSLSDEMSTWLRCAADPTWLTSLKTISFHLDVLGEHNTSSPIETPAVITRFFDVLCSRRPSLSIIQ
jgi:hypothetical protein